MQIKHSSLSKEKGKKALLGHRRLLSVDMHWIAHGHNERNINAEVHLAQTSSYKVESLTGLNILLLYLYGKKKCNNFQVSKRFQRTHSVLLFCCIKLWTKAVLSSDSFFRNIVLRQEWSGRHWSRSNVESGKATKTRAPQETNPIGIGVQG